MQNQETISAEDHGWSFVINEVDLDVCFIQVTQPRKKLKVLLNLSYDALIIEVISVPDQQVLKHQ